MGNSQPEGHTGSIDDLELLKVHDKSHAIQVNADVAFRTCNFSPLPVTVDHKVLIVKCIQENQMVPSEFTRYPPGLIDFKDVFTKKCSVNDARQGRERAMSITADRRRALLLRDENVTRLLDRGYHIVTVFAFDHSLSQTTERAKKVDDVQCECDSLIVVMVKEDNAGNKTLYDDGNEITNSKLFDLHIVNAPIDLNRLDGETLVVGSQKLVMSASVDYENMDGEDLLGTIAHETANGGRLAAVWSITENDENTQPMRAELLFELPASNAFRNTTGSDETGYFAYQVSLTNDPFECFDKTPDVADRHRNIHHLSNHMQKSLEAGWSVVDVLLGKPNVLIWFLERTVTDALGRLIELSLYMDTYTAEEINNSLNKLGRDGWVMKTLLNLPIQVTSGDTNYYVAFFQRAVCRTPPPVGISFSAGHNNTHSEHNESFELREFGAWPLKCQSQTDVFAPPLYGNSGGSLNIPLLHTPTESVEDESDLPQYEDAVDPK